MRALLFFLLLALTPEVLAQGAPSASPWGHPDRAEMGENARMLSGGIAAAIASGVATATVVGDGMPLEASVPLVYAVSAAGFALGVHGTAQLLRVDGSLRNALGDALTGAAIGGVLGGGLILIANAADTPGPACNFLCVNNSKVETLAMGATVAFLVPAVWVIADYRGITPTVIYGPEGQTVSGLSVSLSF